MRIFVKCLTLSIFGLVLAPLAHAQVLGNLSCQSSNGASINASVFAFEVAEAHSGSTVALISEFYIDYSYLGQALTLVAQSPGNSYSCTATNGRQIISFTGGQLQEANGEGEGAGFGPPNGYLYTSISFLMTSLTAGGVTVSAASPDALTADQKARAMAALNSKTAAHLAQKAAAGQ